MNEPRFQDGLYRGTAGAYDRYRPAYPHAMLSDLMERARIRGGARLLDLACGTGQIALAIHASFAEVLAVDSEPEMIALAHQRATDRGASNIRWIVERAEELDASQSAFDLVTIGNAFHRLERRRVAELARDWLRPGGAIAVVWADTPWVGSAAWQEALRHVMAQWTERLRAHDRVPAELEQVLRDTPHAQVLAAAGFEFAGKFEFIETHEWTADTLDGFVLSTSLLSPVVLGDQIATFESDLRERLHAAEPSGVFAQALSFAYEFARKPD